MVYELETESRQKKFIIAPNQAMTWSDLIVLYLCMSVVTLAIAIFFMLQGLVLVLPFAGLELLALGAALYVTAWRGGVREVITIEPDAVLYETGRTEPEYTYSFQRQWAKVIVEKPWIAWHPSRLLIRSHGREIEIGRFLNEQERLGLAKILRLAI